MALELNFVSARTNKRHHHHHDLPFILHMPLHTCKARRALPVQSSSDAGGRN